MSSQNPFHRIPKPKQKNIQQPADLVGLLVTGRVVDVAHGGDGVLVHESGLRMFVPGVWQDERVTVRVASQQKSHAVAELVEVLEASQWRHPAPCRYHGLGGDACGGCAWMFIAYEEQLRQKQKTVFETLRTLEVSAIAEIKPAASALGYRNRAQAKSDGQMMGFVSAQTKALVDVEQCLVLTEANQAIYQTLRAQLPNTKWRPRKKQPWVTVNFDEESGVEGAKVNQRLPFRQVNASQNNEMQVWLTNQLKGLSINAMVLECFCGAGNLTQCLVESGFSNIIAIDAIDEAVQALHRFADLGVVPVTADLFQVDTFHKLAYDIKPAQVLVLDPPREGMKTISTLLRICNDLEKIIYISCDLLSFKRDAERILQNGFVCRLVQPLDMFPQTAHVELMAVFDRV